MAASNFENCLALVLQSEGQNSDDPDDHGGRTSRGVTQKEYSAWRHLQGLPPLDVWDAPQSDINTIYHNEYWEPNCDDLPIGVDYIYFNGCVLDGPVAATRILQRAVGVADDGRIGPITRAAINNTAPTTIILKMSAESAAYYQSLHQPKYIKGWLNRVNFVQQNALLMVIQSNMMQI